MKQPKELRRIQSLNVLKFIMATFVISAHTLCLTGMDNIVANSYFLKYILRVAVPVFFIISGYLLFRKMDVAGGEINHKRIRRYLFKIIILYVVFYFLYSFIAWYVAAKEGIGFSEFLVYQLRKFLFVGESAYSWALWYLHGLVLAVLIIWLILKLFPKVDPKVFLFLSVVVWLMGAAIEVIGSEKMSTVPGYDGFIFLFERVQRNGIFTGFPFVALGLWLSQTNKLDLKTSIILIAIGLMIGLFKFDIGRLVLAIGIVTLALNISLKDRTIYSYLGFVSKWIFLLHMSFIFVFIVLIKHKTDSTLGGNGLGLFCFTLMCSLIASTLIWVIHKIRIGNRGMRSRYMRRPKRQISE